MRATHEEIKKYGTLIFTSKWKMLLCYKYTINLDQVEVFGVPTLGTIEDDSAMMNELTTVYRSINDMVELHKEDIPFRIANYVDTTSIYNIVQKYLEAWGYLLNNGINIGNAPTDDLMALERFAQKLYGYATVNQEIRSNTSHAWFGGKDNISNNRNNIGGVVPKSEIGERTALEELFASAMSRRGINRGN